MNFFGKFSTVISERRANPARFSINEMVNGVKEKFSSVGSRFNQINSSVNSTHNTPENIGRQVENDFDGLANSEAYHASLQSESSAEGIVKHSCLNEASYDPPLVESEAENKVKPCENSISGVPPGSYVTAVVNRSRVKIDKTSAYYQNGDVISPHNSQSTVVDRVTDLTVSA